MKRKARAVARCSGSDDSRGGCLLGSPRVARLRPRNPDLRRRRSHMSRGVTWRPTSRRLQPHPATIRHQLRLGLRLRFYDHGRGRAHSANKHAESSMTAEPAHHDSVPADPAAQHPAGHEYPLGPAENIRGRRCRISSAFPADPRDEVEEKPFEKSNRVCERGDPFRHV